MVDSIVEEGEGGGSDRSEEDTGSCSSSGRVDRIWDVDWMACRK
eukprot:CAMPEP_0198268476 /NCGR_PEP_ID=MMETSP1447-20131203/37350_1 /TAXON_ID=420782 /ORGANISM="Chaetoceros dichaeta, Strain CCMP1751" /LENGTH=43 /DNA_ID= /DNA_START= /DNA_END= /DNA_ORIENTATION=